LQGRNWCPTKKATYYQRFYMRLVR